MPVPSLTLRLEKGSDLTYGELDGDFIALRDFCNGLEQRIDVSIGPDGAVDTAAILNAILAQLSLKVGDLIWSAALLNDDASRLLCNGQEVARADFAELFAAIGATYGAPASSANFLVPDHRAHFPIMVGTLASGTGIALGQTGGAEKIGLALTNMVAHTHGIISGDRVVNSGGDDSAGPLYSAAGVSRLKETVFQATGMNGTPFSKMPPYIGQYVYIRTGKAP